MPHDRQVETDGIGVVDTPAQLARRVRMLSTGPEIEAVITRRPISTLNLFNIERCARDRSGTAGEPQTVNRAPWVL